MNNSISNIVLALVNLLRPLIKWEFDWDGDRITLYTDSQDKDEYGYKVEVYTAISFNEDTVEVKLTEEVYCRELRGTANTYFLPISTNIRMKYKVGEGWSTITDRFGFSNDDTDRAYELRVLIVEVTKNHNQNWSLN